MARAALLLLLAAGAAEASPLELTEGRSALQPCLDDAACEDRVTSLVGESLSEYGLILQSDPLATSALAGKGWGPVLEIRVDSATLGAKNALEERTRIPPGLPRIGAGWQLGPRTWDTARPQLALGATVLPPVRVQGGVLSTVQADASFALPVVRHLLWVGAEASYGGGLIELPLIGSEQQLDGIESATGVAVERDDSRCAEGCLDTYRQTNATGRVGVSFDPHPAFFTYTRVAMSSVRARLSIDYDDTSWTLNTVQIQSQTGVGLRAGNYQLALGAVVMPRSRELATSGDPTIVKLVASTSWRLGPVRGRSDPPVEIAANP